MGKDELVRFFTVYLPSNAAVRGRLARIENEADLARALVAEASVPGFHFTEADVRETLRSGSGGAVELSDEQLAGVSGGRAGSDPLKYMEIKLKEVLISGVIV